MTHTNYRVLKSGIMIDSALYSENTVKNAISIFSGDVHVTAEKKSHQWHIHFESKNPSDLKKAIDFFNTELVKLKISEIKTEQMRQSTIKGNRFMFVINHKCNNNCLHCAESENRSNPEPSAVEIKKTLEDVLVDGFSDVFFSGGEPTLRKDIIELVGFAKSRGYRVLLFTNGRKFSGTAFAEHMASAGLYSVVIPLHSHIPEVHDRVTSVRGSYKETMQGICNCLEKNILVNIKIIPTKLNYISLPETVEFIGKNFKGSRIIFDMLHIGGNALRNESRISVKRSKTAKYLEKALDFAIDKNLDVTVESFPLCLIERKYWGCIRNSRIVVSAYKKSLSETRIGGEGQILAEKCSVCSVKDRCPGTWESYFKRYGDSELKPLVS